MTQCEWAARRQIAEVGHFNGDLLPVMGVTWRPTTELSELSPVSPESELAAFGKDIATALHKSVLDAYAGFTSKFEGYTPYMYTDVKGLMTTGIGNLIDSVPGSPEATAVALSLPWKHKSTGVSATPNEIRAAWRKVKAAFPKVQSVASADLTDLRLDKDAISKLVQGRLLQDSAYLNRRFPTYNNRPADGQLGIHSWAWAVGPGAKFPAFDKALRGVPDFKAAAKAVHISEAGNPGVVPRNKANVHLFENAAAVFRKGVDHTKLYYPSRLGMGIAGGTVAAVVAGAVGVVWYRRRKA